MKVPVHVFREYDIRGNAARDLSDELAHNIGRGLATVIGSTIPSGPFRVAVGRDCRLSSQRLFEQLTRGLQSAGAEVIDIGLGPTPLVYFAAHHLQTDASIMITGSHNPAEDNGFKMMRGTKSFFGADIQTLRECIEQERFTQAEGGSLTTVDISDAYIEAVTQATTLKPGHKRTKRVTIDAGNGAAGPLATRTLKALGYDADTLFCDMDGRFPNHHPDPTVEKNLSDLKKRVAEHGSDLGIAFDGDGDRIGVVDGEGNVIWGDKLMILFSRALLTAHPGAAILGEVKCSQTLFDAIEKAGGRALICRTGHSLIKTRMKEEKALLAGEMSGHIFFADRYFGFDDAVYAAVRLLEILEGQSSSIQQLLSDVPQTYVTPEIRMECPDEHKFAVVDAVKTHFAKTHSVLTIDGARIDFGEGAWGLCRASNTGPVLVLRFEALSQEVLDKIHAEVRAVAEQAKAELGAA